MTINRNLSVLAEGANSSGVLGAANGGTGLSTPGTNGNVLTSNGSAWVSSAPAAAGVTSVTGTAPVVSSGGTTPAISMAAATASVNGYLTSTDWTTFNSKQAAFGSQTANYFYAAPNGSAGVPSFRALVAADVPTLNQSTTGNAATATTATNIASGATGSLPYQSGAGATTFLAAGTNGNVLTLASGVPSWTAPAGGVTLSNDTATATNLYPTFASATSGSVSTIYTGNANLLYKPSTGELQSQVPVAINGIVVNNATINTSYTIPSGYNAVSAGPVTVASGIVITVQSGSVWAIV